MVDGVPSPERMYEATLELLNMSQTPCPHAGLILRSSVSVEDCRDLALQPGSPATAADAELDFLQPVNQAMQDWWRRKPLDETITPNDLAFVRMAQAVEVDDHLDQVVPVQGVTPKYGPVTATLTLKGSIDYRLATTRIDVFSPHARHHLEAQHHMRHLPHRASHVRANETDTVVFMNLPPTMHGGTGSPGRKTYVYTSHFRPTLG